LLAIYNIIKCFLKIIKNKQILLRVDSTVAISYINKLGGCKSPRLHQVARDIFKLAESNSISLYASYIASRDNYIADKESRADDDDSDWMLDREIFLKFCNDLNFSPNIDLFASHLTRQCKVFVSWHPDPESTYVDAFTLDWEKFRFYAFPPFSMIARSLKKVQNDNATGLFIVPWWPTQYWFPLFKSLAISKIIIIEPNENVLKSFYSHSPHPLAKTLRLAAAVVSNKGL
jgi:hypothetical protein